MTVVMSGPPRESPAGSVNVAVVATADVPPAAVAAKTSATPASRRRNTLRCFSGGLITHPSSLTRRRPRDGVPGRLPITLSVAQREPTYIGSFYLHTVRPRPVVGAEAA